MDRYIIKQPRTNLLQNDKPSKSKHMRQATIESLQGVVIVEDIWRQKAVLKVPDQSKDNILAAFEKLNEKIPSRDVLQKTKIGHTVNRLTKHEDHEVVEKAQELVTKWKDYFEQKLDRPMIEVKCDKRTEELRKAGRKMIGSALKLPEKHILAETIEREAYSQHSRRVSNAYRRCIRTLVFTLRGQEDIRKKVLDRQIEVADLVTMHKKDQPQQQASTSKAS